MQNPMRLVAQLKMEAGEMRQPEGAVVSELADQLANAIAAPHGAVTEPYAASLLGLVTALQPIEARGWFAGSSAVLTEQTTQLRDVRFALAIAKRHLGITA